MIPPLTITLSRDTSGEVSMHAPDGELDELLEVLAAAYEATLNALQAQYSETLQGAL